MLNNGSAFWNKAITLAHMASERFHINRKVKESLKKDTDTAMGGTGDASQSIRQIVDEQLARAMQSFKAKQGNQKRKGGKPKPPSDKKPTSTKVSKKTQTK
ncbi:hypothetical protein MMC31_006029, partial [Peltigera leucophlebia]|nr:hypothetical protein [Peltigera leucophlebia]